jgi:hypothetical protein
MILVKLFQPIQNTSTLWFASTTIAILETLASNTISLADKFPTPTKIVPLADGMSLYGESPLSPMLLAKSILYLKNLAAKRSVLFIYLNRSLAAFMATSKAQN